jgi:hypothetical protein
MGEVVVELGNMCSGYLLGYMKDTVCCLHLLGLALQAHEQERPRSCWLRQRNSSRYPVGNILTEGHHILKAAGHSLMKVHNFLGHILPDCCFRRKV